MSILYKSSSFETYVYYIIYPILIGISIFFSYGILSYGNLSLFTAFFVLFFIFMLIFSIDSLYRLRYIEVTEDQILIKKIIGSEIIQFKDVEYVYNLMNINGNSLVIWYKDPQTQKSKVILVRPDEKNPSPETGFPVYSYGSIELNITKFIREKATKVNPNYLYRNNPRWFLLCLR